MALYGGLYMGCSSGRSVEGGATFIVPFYPTSTIINTSKALGMPGSRRAFYNGKPGMHRNLLADLDHHCRCTSPLVETESSLSIIIYHIYTVLCYAKGILEIAPISCGHVAYQPNLSPLYLHIKFVPLYSYVSFCM